MTVLFLALFGVKEVQAQACTSLSIDKDPVKAVDTVTFSSGSDVNANNFYYAVFNRDNSSLPVCVNSGGDITSQTSGCPVVNGYQTYQLIFKDGNTTMRTTGAKTLTPTQLFLRDYNIYQPYGGGLQNAQIKAYVAIDNGTWSPENTNCMQNVSYYRPPVCTSSSQSGAPLTTNSPVNITIDGTPPGGTAITNFTLAFYNLDNLFGPGNPKGIIFGGQNYVATACTRNGNSCTFTVNYADLDRVDENWSNQYPTNVSTMGYFTLDDSGFSAPMPACVQQFSITRQQSPIPNIPTSTPTPTPQTLGWYAPDSSKCDSTNYYAYFPQSDCSQTQGQPVGYQVEGVPEQTPCSLDGTFRCFTVGGNQLNNQINSYFSFKQQACIANPPTFTPNKIYDTLYECSWTPAPDASVSGNVILNFSSPDQFEKIFLWLRDAALEENVKNLEIPKAMITPGAPMHYEFINLFPNRQYDVFSKAYYTDGTYIDNVDYMGSCGSPSCRVNPPAKIDFIVDFPQLPAGQNWSSLSTNEAFSAMMEKWIKGEITALEMSQFIEVLRRVPGLQKATCEPRIGGCTTP